MDIGPFYDGIVLPELFARLPSVFPEFGWKSDGRGGWVASPAGDAALLAAILRTGAGKLSAAQCAKIVCTRSRPWGWYCHKTGDNQPWAAYVAGGVHAGAVRGAEFARAVRELAGRCGIDTADLDRDPGKETDDERRARLDRLAEAEKLAAERAAEAELARLEEDRAATAKAWTIWENAGGWRGGAEAVEGYARYRGLDADALRGDLATLRGGPIKVGVPVLAVLCPVVNATLEFTGLQRIAVNADGSAREGREGEKIKVMEGRVMGGAVRFGPSGEADAAPLYLCEGVETALAIRQAMPDAEVWATLSAGGLERVDLSIVGEWRVLVACGDLDASGRGQAACASFAGRAAAEGRACVVKLPDSERCADLVEAVDGVDRPRHGKSVDWLDVVVHGAGAAAAAELLREGVHAASRPPTPPSAADASNSGGGSGDAPTPPGGARSPTGTGDEEELLWAGQTRRARLALHRVWGRPRGQREGERFGLIFWEPWQQWYEWRENRWKKASDGEIVASLDEFFFAWRIKAGKNAESETKHAGLTIGEVRGIYEKLKAPTKLSSEDYPVWAPVTYDGDAPVFERAKQSGVSAAARRGRDLPDPTLVLSTESGLLRIDAWDRGRLEIMPHTPAFFTEHHVPHALPVDEINAVLEADPENETLGFDLWSRYAPNFARLVDQIGDGDERKRDVLLEWAGYLLTPDVSFEKALVLTGPPGSGKNTYELALRAMLGDEMVRTSSFTQLGQDKHHAYSLLGGALAVIQDAHVHEIHADRALEVAKCIASGDRISVKRMWVEERSATILRTKLMICANEMPRFRDPSGSWAQRLLLVPMTKGHRRNPDRSIKDGIVHEGLGVLLAAMFGRRQLLQRGAFSQPADGAAVLAQYELDNAPVAAFVDECCEIGEGKGVRTSLLYQLYAAWAEHHGRRKMASSTFGEHLKMALPHVQRREQQVLGRRVYNYWGVRPRAVETFVGDLVTEAYQIGEMEFPFGGDGGSPSPPLY